MTETRWVIGKAYDGHYVLVEVRGRVTGCYFWIDTKWGGGKSYRAAAWMLRHSNRLPKDDKRLHHSRGVAIRSMLATLQAERKSCERRVVEIDAELEIVDKLNTQ